MGIISESGETGCLRRSLLIGRLHLRDLGQKPRGFPPGTRERCTRSTGWPAPSAGVTPVENGASPSWAPARFRRSGADAGGTAARSAGERAARTRGQRTAAFACLFTIGEEWALRWPSPAAPLAKRRLGGGGRTVSFAGRRGAVAQCGRHRLFLRPEWIREREGSNDKHRSRKDAQFYRRC